MALVGRHAKTEKQLAANRRNQALRHGPVTDDGEERIGAAHIQEGNAVRQARWFDCLTFRLF
jgi:hypothetical protein